MTTPAPPVYNGRYELRRQIGRGGTAQVYLAHDLLLDRPVALKMLMSELSRDRSFVERFRREAQAAANLTHPNIVSVFDWGESGDTYFIVMEYVDGESLASIIRTQAPLDPSQAASIGADIANALSYAHRHGVVHRDVKPGNVLITADGQVKVADFGIARAVGSDDQITQTGLVMGTAAYFSPEQAQGLGVDGRSDVYALGVVLYEMVVGRTPFHGENPVSIAYQHVREEPPAPRSLNPEVPLDLEAIVLQALAKLPAERYQTADDLRADLVRYVHHQTVLARPPTGATGAMTEAVTVAAAAGSAGAAGATTALSTLERAEPPVISTEDDDDLPPRTTTRWWVLAGVLLLVGILVIGAIIGRDLGYFGANAYVRVPDVTGQQVSAALTNLSQRHLNAKKVSTPATNSQQQTNIVTLQNPDAGTTIREHDTVTIHYFTPPNTVTVPDVSNETAAAATTKLKNAGLVAVVVPRQATSQSQVQGTVIAMSPQAGTTADRHSTVKIFVASGSVDVAVPNVVGDSPTVAANILGEAKLTLGTTTAGSYSSSVASGNIVATVPAVGTIVAPHTVVNLKTSRGTGAVMPYIVGEPVGQAEQTLATAGLTGSITQSCVTVTDPSQINVVQSQFPAYRRTVGPAYPVSFTFGCPASTPTTVPTTTLPGSADATPTTLPPA